MGDENYVVDEATATEQFERFLEQHGLEDINERGLDDEERRSALEARRIFIKMTTLGRLWLDERGCPVYKLRDGSAEITFKGFTGAALMVQDQKKSGHDWAKMFATLGELTGKPLQYFATMGGQDLRVCQFILLLFLN